MSRSGSSGLGIPPFAAPASYGSEGTEGPCVVVGDSVSSLTYVAFPMEFRKGESVDWKCESLILVRTF